MAFLRTAALLGLLTGVLLAAGFFFAGFTGMTLALIFAVFINFISYWFSDKIVLSMYRAKPLEDKKLDSIVEKLAKEANIPKPKLYTVKAPIPNAFATGRNPKNSAVVVTDGLLNTLDEEEIEGVLAHELSHIKNRDTLVSVMAATIAGAISFLAQMAWYSLIFGNRRQGGGSLVLLPLLILAPLAAILIQLAISRGREFHADYTGAIISKKPLALASALEKISHEAKARPMSGNSATSHLWIVNPFKGDNFVKLFMTHPETSERIKRLKEIKI